MLGDRIITDREIQEMGLSRNIFALIGHFSAEAWRETGKCRCVETEVRWDHLYRALRVKRTYHASAWTGRLD